MNEWLANKANEYEDGISIPKALVLFDFADWLDTRVPTTDALGITVGDSGSDKQQLANDDGDKIGLPIEMELNNLHVRHKRLIEKSERQRKQIARLEKSRAMMRKEMRRRKSTDK